MNNIEHDHVTLETTINISSISLCTSHVTSLWRTINASVSVSSCHYLITASRRATVHPSEKSTTNSSVDSHWTMVLWGGGDERRAVIEGKGRGAREGCARKKGRRRRTKERNSVLKSSDQYYTSHQVQFTVKVNMLLQVIFRFRISRKYKKILIDFWCLNHEHTTLCSHCHVVIVM